MIRRPAFALACALLALPALADTAIHLDQQAQKVVPRDRLQAELRVEASGPDSRSVQDEVNRRMGTALAKARKVSALTVQSGGYGVYREQPAKPGTAEIWHASQSLTLVSKDFDAVLKLSGELQNDGLAMSSLRFSLAPETLRGAQSELTAQALSGLRERANEIAGDLGMNVAQYKDITIGNANEGFDNRRPVMFAKAAAAPMAVAPPDAEAGDSTISLNVQAEVILTDKR